MKVEVVAEISSNHLGKLKRALALIDAAADAGADAVKFQCWTPGTMCVTQHTITDGPWAGRNLAELYEQAHTPWEWFDPLIRRCKARSIGWFSSVYDRNALAFQETLDCARYKIASFEIEDFELIDACVATGKSLILSTGMASSKEIHRASLRAEPADLTLLHCVSAYPAKVEDANLRVMLKLPCSKYGLSDHGLDTIVPTAAAAMGAVMIEKHLTLLRADGGLDAAFSLEPPEFAWTVQCVRQAVLARGDGRRVELTGEAPQRALRRSLWVTSDAWPVSDTWLGDVVSNRVASARPAGGLPCSQWEEVKNRRFARAAKAGEPLSLDMLTPALAASETR